MNTKITLISSLLFLISSYSHAQIRGTFKYSNTSAFNSRKAKYSFSISSCNGNCACGGKPKSDAQYVMTDDDFVDAEDLVKRQIMEKDMLIVAKSIVNNNLMTSHQINTIAKKLFFSDTQLIVLKSGYRNCVDKTNYLKIIDTFSSIFDRNELRSFIDKYDETVDDDIEN